MYCSTIIRSLALLAIPSFATASPAPKLQARDLHINAQCVDTGSGQNVYNSAATIAACGNYLERNTGSEWYDTCPDCAMVDNSCNSPAKHIGGDEISYYCQLNGASNALT